MLTIWILSIVTIIGIVTWTVGYRKTKKLPLYDRLRGISCLPGAIITLVALISLVFYWQWIVGVIVMCFLGYLAYKLLT